MNKSLVATLIVFTLLTNPVMTNAGLFGSSFDGCKDPEDDIAGYILEKSGDSTLTRSSIEQTLKFVPTDVENVTYGDIFGWLRVTENSAECFIQNDYAKGLKIIGTHTGKFVASKALGVATVQLVGSTGGAVVFLPPTIFKWWADDLIEGIKNTAIHNQLVLYIAAIESCEESYGSRAQCQQMIIDESKYGGEGTTAFFYPNGFIMDTDIPKNPKFINITVRNSIKPSMFKAGVAGQIGITPQEFYKGAAVVYDAIATKYSGSLDAVRSAAIKGVVAETKKVAGENSNTKTPDNQSVGFFSGLRQIFTNSVKTIYTNVKKNFTGVTSQKDATIIQPNDLSGQISTDLSGDANKESHDLTRESNTANWQEQLRQIEDAKNKQAETEKRRLEAERQKLKDQRKIDEQRRAEMVAEEAIKKAKTSEEQRIAEEARKNAEQAKIVAEREAQKHQQEEDLRRAQEEQRQAEEQRRSQAVAEEARRKTTPIFSPPTPSEPQPIDSRPAPPQKTPQPSIPPTPTPTPASQQPAPPVSSADQRHKIIGTLRDPDGQLITGYARFNLKDLSKRDLLSLSGNKNEMNWDTAEPWSLGSYNASMVVPDGKYVLTIVSLGTPGSLLEWNVPMSLEINVSGADVNLGNIIVSRRKMSKIIATVVDQKGVGFKHLIFGCKKLDGSNLQDYTSNCPAGYSFDGLMTLGPYRSGKYRITIQGGHANGSKSDAVVKDVQITEDDGEVVDLGNIVLKRWGRILASLVDGAGNPFLAYFSWEGVFDTDLCVISPTAGTFGSQNMSYYCSGGQTFFKYYDSYSVRMSFFEYQLPDGQYTLKITDFPYSGKELYKTAVTISQGQDVNLGTVHINP